MLQKLFRLHLVGTEQSSLANDRGFDTNRRTSCHVEKRCVMAPFIQFRVALYWQRVAARKSGTRAVDRWHSFELFPDDVDLLAHDNSGTGLKMRQ